MIRNGVSTLYVALCLTVPIRGSQAQIAGCRTPDATDAMILTYVREFASFDIPARDSVGLTGLDTTAIVLETDSTACVSITRGVDSVFNKPASTAAYVVVRAGSQYVAYDPRTGPNGEWGQLVHFVVLPFDYRRTLVAY